MLFVPPIASLLHLTKQFIHRFNCTQKKAAFHSTQIHLISWEGRVPASLVSHFMYVLDILVKLDSARTHTCLRTRPKVI